MEKYIKPGELTTEYEVTQRNSNTSIIAAIVGALLAIGPQIIDSLSAVDVISQSRPGGLILAVVGGLVSIAALLNKAMVDSKYVDGRNLLKAVALKNATPATPPAPPAPDAYVTDVPRV